MTGMRVEAWSWLERWLCKLRYVLTMHISNPIQRSCLLEECQISLDVETEKVTSFREVMQAPSTEVR